MQKGATWLKHLLAELINTNASAPPECNDLVVPITVSTQQDAVDLRCVCINAAMPLAINIPMPMLTLEQTHAVSTSWRNFLVYIPESIRIAGVPGLDRDTRVTGKCVQHPISLQFDRVALEQVVLDLARRAARSARQPELPGLSDDAAQAWTHVHMFAGGSPRLLSWFLEDLSSSHVLGTGWSEGDFSLPALAHNTASKVPLHTGDEKCLPVMAAVHHACRHGIQLYHSVAEAHCRRHAKAVKHISWHRVWASVFC